MVTAEAPAKAMATVRVRIRGRGRVNRLQPGGGGVEGDGVQAKRAHEVVEERRQRETGGRVRLWAGA